MKLKHIITIATVLASTTLALGQGLKFTEYLGQIPLTSPVLPVAGDKDGRLFFGTFEAGSSKLGVIHDPVAATGGTTTAVDIIHTFPTFPNLRGLQSIQVASNGDVFAAGDTGDAAVANVWKFVKGAGDPPVYTQDTAFSAAANLFPARRSSAAIVSETAGGVLLVNGFKDIDFYNFAGVHLGGPFTVGNNYMRESLYNSLDNVLYPLRNGAGRQPIIEYFVSNLNVVSGGTLTTKTLIANGGANGALGSARQNGFYYAAQHQLFTCDSDVNIGTTPVPPQLRVWDITDNGTKLTLAYDVKGTSTLENFTSIGDVVVINDRMYVSSSTRRAIFVFGPAPSAVKTWGRYESTRPAAAPAE